jgi:hypothetical protein
MRQFPARSGQNHDLFRAEPLPWRFADLIGYGAATRLQVINADELAEVICKEIHDQRLRLLGLRAPLTS